MATVDHSWRAQARCAAVGTDAFFDFTQEAEAKAVCARCPVREACLAYAVETRQPDGVWGGLNEQERLALARAATAGGSPLLAVTYTTRARSTGATCSAGRTAMGWGTTCETHDTLATARSRTAAEHAVSRPQEWCSQCALISRGKQARVARPE